MDTAVLVFVCVLVISLWGSAISALVSAVRLPGYAWQSAKRSKNGTVLGILLTGGIGGAYYWLSIRQSVKEAQNRIPPPPKRDPWTNDGW